MVVLTRACLVAMLDLISRLDWLFTLFIFIAAIFLHFSLKNIVAQQKLGQALSIGSSFSVAQLFKSYTKMAKVG